jgi:hypothetical protein
MFDAPAEALPRLAVELSALQAHAAASTPVDSGSVERAAR